jgi:hypothetical protein
VATGGGVAATGAGVDEANVDNAGRNIGIGGNGGIVIVDGAVVVLL